MSRLFIELYLDEDVSVLIAHLLRVRGFVIVTTQEAGKLGASDREQLEFATGRRMTLLTHNRRHFEALAQHYFEANQTHTGIIIATRHPPRQIVARLLAILNSVTADEIENQLSYI